MLFNSLDFLVFFPLVTVLYFLVPHRFRWIHLLVASCVFYMFFIPAYILILLFTVTLDYFAGIAIEKASGRRRKWFLVMSIAGNLGVLAVFKYGGFFTAQVNALLQVLHSPGSLPVWEIILPIGLSFHTFQAMSYTIEVYRGNYPAERHFGLYAVYVLFYPQLVAGPIERPAGLLRQLRERHVFDWGNLGVGLRLMLWGFFKKLVIADRLGGYVNYVYNNLDHLSSVYVVLAVVFFSFQIYCDFSGYSDIAIGAARTMGFRLVTNFDRPYFARNIREFWARWHISLTSWFRDYVYIPMGGNRVHWYRNILFVFLLSGLWHGAGWNFIVWGVLHGVLLVGWVVFRRRVSAGRLASGRLGSGASASGALPSGASPSGALRSGASALRSGASPSGTFASTGFGWIGVVGTFLAVSVLWVFFRCGDLGQAVHVLSHLVGYVGDVHFEKNIGKTTIALGILFVVFMLLVERWTTPGMEELGRRFWVDAALCAVALGCILLFGVFGSQPFIYFQF